MSDATKAPFPYSVCRVLLGGKHVINLAHGDHASNSKPLIDVVFTGHPSQLDIPGKTERIEKPISVAVGDKDAMLSLSQVGQIKAILGSMEVKSEVNVYHGARHGIKLLDGGYKNILSIFEDFGVAATRATRLTWENMDGADRGNEWDRKDFL